MNKMTETKTQLVRVQDADRVVQARPTQDGEGVKISRIAGQHVNALLDPFLLIDEINSDAESDYVGGFPPHPHRGFQTLTYMIDGSFHHKDSMGNKGKVGPGGVQWMSAASGVIHSEMPEPAGKKLRGFQLWLNLPAAEKMRAPEYRDVQSDEVPVYQVSGGITISALAGRMMIDEQSVEGALLFPETNAAVLSIDMLENQSITLTLPAGTQTNVLVFDGELEGLSQGHLANFAKAESERSLQLNSGTHSASVLVLSGEPIEEPIAQYGPFVMNTMEEVEQALRDYRDGKLVA